MAEQKQEWDYCRIEVKLRHKGEDETRSGVKQIWLAFVARASGPYQSYLAGDVEIPLPGNVAGASFAAQRNNVGHVNAHQTLLRKLQDDGWELLPEKGGDWWGNACAAQRGRKNLCWAGLDESRSI